MRHALMKLWSVLPVALLATSCEKTNASEAPAPLRQAPQAVLYRPPPPPSGNIYDSTTYLGPVLLGRSVQTYFTQDPQFYSFKVTVPGTLTARFEVTHGGSTLYLDTGLLVYGPKDASGSYGTYPRYQDDNYGYDDLSKIENAYLTAGEYLVVVSSGSGAGKQFRLVTSCLSGACPTVPAPPPNTAGIPLGLTEQPLTAQLAATLQAGNAERDWTEGELNVFSFDWTYSSQPTLTQADDSVIIQPGYGYGAWAADDALAVGLPEAQAYFYSEFEPLYSQLLATYGNGTEHVQVATRYHSYLVAPGADGWFRLFVILFPESRKVVVFKQTGYET